MNQMKSIKNARINSEHTPDPLVPISKIHFSRLLSPLQMVRLETGSAVSLDRTKLLKKVSLYLIMAERILDLMWKA